MQISPLIPDPPTLPIDRLHPIMKQKHPEWTEARLQEALSEYSRFLQLCKMNPGRKISAPPDVDEVWHAHMLDSVHYVRDCDQYFGHYLHHDPCIGELDLESADDTLNIFRQTFQEEPPMAWAGLMTCANPGKGCGSVYVS